MLAWVAAMTVRFITAIPPAGPFLPSIAERSVALVAVDPALNLGGTYNVSGVLQERPVASVASNSQAGEGPGPGKVAPPAPSLHSLSRNLATLSLGPHRPPGTRQPGNSRAGRARPFLRPPSLLRPPATGLVILQFHH
jgi:hypothetical protein